MNCHHLGETLLHLGGATTEQIIVSNQWAAVGLNRFHPNSSVEYNFVVDRRQFQGSLTWDSEFTAAAMREVRHIAEDGGVSLAFFVMSVLLDYVYVVQSEIGEGTDYGFLKVKPNSDNFFRNCHFVEVSGLLEEQGTNTLANRIRLKHNQINRGTRRNEPSSVIVTLFQRPMTIKEIHL